MADHQPAGFGQHAVGVQPVAAVIDHDAAQGAVRVARAGVDHHLRADLVEHAFLHHEHIELATDFKQILPEHHGGDGHQPQIQHVAQRDGAAGEAQSRAGDGELRHAGGAHHR